MNRIRLLLCAFLTLLALPAAWAQQSEPAVLIADRMFIRPDGVLVAEGNVEAHQGNLFLTASRVTYSPDSNQLNVQGPIKLDDGESIRILADEAELDPQLVEGLLTGARLILGDELQIAAVELNRAEGRYTQAYRTVATSCRICGENTPPIWQIRAEKVIHDSLERQIYFENAQFQVLGVPVAFLPIVRLPDPTLSRSTGFLVPAGRTSSTLGVGYKVPYFIALGDHRDITLTPYLSTETTTLEYRYRQAFARGDFTANGAISQDSFTPELRAYVFANGAISLPNAFQFSYDVELTSDTAYLLDYGYSGKDRLDSAFALSRYDTDRFARVGLTHYRTLRDSEANDTQPSIVGRFETERVLPEWSLGGDVILNAQMTGLLRTSGNDLAGRDVVRARGSAEWTRSDVMRNGLLIDSHVLMDASLAAVGQDSTTEDLIFSASPGAYTNLRYPMLGADSLARYTLEPVVHFAWSDSVNDIPNEESTLVEFDEANLLSLSRFPATDRVEEGPRMAFGGNWARYGNNGSTTRFSLGRVIRAEADDDHSQSSGLDGTHSDWLVAGQYKSGTGIELFSRAIFDDQITFTKAESRLNWDFGWGNVAATHIWLIADADENRTSSHSEINLSSSIDIARHWGANANWQYDLAAERIVRAGIGATYENECIDMSLSASRRFTSSATVDPSTDYDFRIGLSGFGAGRGGADVIRTCGN